MKLEVRVFDDYGTDNSESCNEFLEQLCEKGNQVISITPLFNTILGGVSFAVVYESLGEYIK